ncbi:hypothetical protein PMAYCL1PPCAC_26387, partial [Pristionchus mayeri]
QDALLMCSILTLMATQWVCPWFCFIDVKARERINFTLITNSTNQCTHVVYSTGRMQGDVNFWIDGPSTKDKSSIGQHGNFHNLKI